MANPEQEHESEQSASDDEKVEEASKESFPASDAPSYTRSPREEESEEEEEEESARDEREPRAGVRGPRHASSDPSAREEGE